MDSYDLFGDDGSGMLEGLTDLGGNHTYAGNRTSTVAGEAKEPTDSSYRQSYNQGSIPPEGSLQKLAAFGGGGAGAIGSNSQPVPAGNASNTAEYHDYGAYPPRPRLPHPPHGPPLHSGHHVHPGHSYPGYHPGPDPMYTMSEHPGISELGVWSSTPSASRYPPITPSYRHPYEHQKLHQYAPQQAMQGVPQNGAYIPRQPHFSHPPSQPVYNQQQNYPGYPQVHPPAQSRIGPYHQQMELTAHQYGLTHTQQNISNVPPQHQGHQAMTGHQGSMPANLQGPQTVHLHHTGPTSLHHTGRQPPSTASSLPTGHTVSSQNPYTGSHHTVPIGYQPHQLQSPLDVNMGSTNQYSAQKIQGLESPQYRPPFQQLSPQISPRAQMSPRPPAPSQLSPHPPISPVKGPNASPHALRAIAQSPVLNSSGSQSSSSFNPQNTLQALEQMVLPGGTEYSYQRNPSSPAVGHIVSSPSQWNQSKMSTSNTSMSLESVDKGIHSTETISVTTMSTYTDPTHNPDTATIDNNVKISNKVEATEKPLDTCISMPDDNTLMATNIDVNSPINVNIAHSMSETKSETELSPNVSNENDIIEPKILAIKDSQENKNVQSSLLSRDDNMESHRIDISTKLSNVETSTSHGGSLLNIHPSATNITAGIIIHEPNLVPQVNASQTTSINNTLNMQSSVNMIAAAANANTQAMCVNRNINYSLSTVLNNVPPKLPSVLNQNTEISNQTSNLPLSGQINTLQNVQPNFQTVIPNSSLPNDVPALAAVQNSASNGITVPQTNISNIPSNMPTSHTIITSNIPVLAPPSTLSGTILNVPNTAGNMPSNIGNIQITVPMPPVQNLHPVIAPNNQNNIVPSMQHNVPVPIPQNLMPQANLPGLLYSNALSHHQERLALQQQIQDLFCLPPIPDNQEKLRCLQDRLAMIQQHETNDKCNGGPNCVLQNPAYNSKMVESPQVSSTTGRGRSKGLSKPRKPRAKKEKNNSLIHSLDQLPVSEDCVTAGTGLQNSTLDMDCDFNEDVTNLDGSIIPCDVINEGKPKKPRAPRKYKERKPRVPKEPKPPKTKPDKPVKERKKRQPRDPNAPKRKRPSKKDENDIQADTTTNYELSEYKDLQTSNQLVPSSDNTLSVSMEAKLEDDLVTDFDDIPVSKIAIKDLLVEAESKRELEERDDDADSFNFSSSKKKTTKRKSLSSNSCKKSSTKRLSGGKKKKRGGIVPESDGEPDDLVSTPPPSPPAEGDCDSLKRRSARNTHRKKYTDDVMLRLSDDEFSVMSHTKRDKDIKPDQMPMEIKESNKGDATPKPNYIYVNTTDEDTMIVQHILSSRMGKRELKPDLTPVKIPVTADIELSEQNSQNIEVKEELAETSENECTDIEMVADSIVEKDAPSTAEEIKTTEDNSDSIVILKEDNKEISTEEPSTDDALDIKMENPILVDVEEYYVKYRNFSYLHCEWKTEEELYKGDKRIFSKIKRFKQKQAQQVNIFELLDDEPFNPDYIEVERILDMSETADSGNENNAKHYLVKWKSLQYEDCTWELEEDIDVDKIKQYKIFNELPAKEKWKFKRRPCAEQWLQLKETPTYKGGNTLRPYQLEGLNWLLFSWHNNRNCILADEMGLGKTIQSLTFVNSAWEYGIRGPFLIIAPLSTIPNWQREFEGWTDMNVIVYHGSQQSKSMIQEYEFYYKSESGEPIKEINKFNVLITTFEIIVTDFQDLKLFNWRLCVIDEAHRLKNRNCKLLEGLRQLHLEHRVLLSGTPLQNNVNELFSLLNFLEPSQFSSSEAFLTEFGQLKSESEVLKLQALLKPMMLRRLKEDVEKSLAPKEETIIEVELTNIQKKYYRAILERNFSFLQKGTASAANIPNLMNTMMELRKCCIHPYLLNGAEDQIQFDYQQAYGEDKQAYYKALIQSSGKMVLVDKLLPKLKAGGHRVLVFSQMVRCLDVLEDYLMFRKYPYERIDGRIRGNLRQEAIDRFSKPDSDRFVFLLCTKAGGLGINLTAADTVIIYDSDWNPQNDLQAQARCHRIGQQKMVKIYRLLCRNTYEREMFDKASLKLGLDKAVLQSMNTGQGKEAGSRQLSKKEIEDLLKKGAYGAVMDEDNAGDKFCEEDIEMILARRTQVIQMESEKGSTFSKASFAANDQRSDIDIRDPDFWNKWAKKAEIDTTEKKEDEVLIVTEPRRRTLIKRYGHDDSTMEMSDIEGTPDTDDDEEGISLRSKKKKDKLGRKGRKYISDDYIPRHETLLVDEEVIYGSWTRSECFKIERGLLTFGWARWEEIIDKNQFRKGWTIPVIEDCARIIVLYCLRHYKGDEKIRNFIWDLIEPCENGEVTIARNHSGLHNPVPRGRNAKKKNKPKDIPKANAVQKWEDSSHWSSGEKYDCEAYLENSYKKHLFRHANKVLLRVRMMYYIKHEVIGDYANQIEAGVPSSGLGMRVPRGVDSAPPRIWWDTDCDVSLLVGTYVHGYENYLAMRSDPHLCFVEKLGPPDDAECTDIKSEELKVLGAGGVDEDCTDEVSSGAGATSPAATPPREDDSTHPWPSMQDLNTRLRRLITAYQRNYKREELKMQQRAKKIERRERIDQIARDEAAQWRWSRVDEESFRRTVASYGVEFDPATKSLRWSRFRALAHLDAKSDDALTDYLKAFMAMCKRQCGLSVGEAELPTRSDLKAEPIGEERAIATLERIDLLRVLREEVAPHPNLDTRLALCEPSPDTPAWWQPAKHDKLLILGVCKHGLGDTYHKLFCDPKLPFADCALKWAASHKMRTKSDVKQVSSDEDEDIKENPDNSITDTHMSRRLRKRNPINVADNDDDTDALSELETLAKLGRTEELPSVNHWFSERALETRLHHIAHTVQNSEWPTASKTQKNVDLKGPSSKSQEDPRSTKKQHIAIDVETDRAKLHALLSSPHPAHINPKERSRIQPENVEGVMPSSSKGLTVWERDDASSDSSSRRSTPAPPPAHQRIAPSPAPIQAPSLAPVDLSAPLDLSEVQDFSLARRTPGSDPCNLSSSPNTSGGGLGKSRLDDTLSKLMKRKNVPEPEVIVGKEKKRKKLDEIVLGLSAAKGHNVATNFSPVEPTRHKNIPIVPNVSVTPTSSSSSNAVLNTQKPFSVTVTNVPSTQASSKELSSFLQQSLEQLTPSKQQKMSAPLPKSYSHEAKVNKWLAEQAHVDVRRRGPQPRLAPDEHVPVVHRVTGKRLVGHKAPQLKHLAQWIAENPMYDIDSKWTEGIKEHVKLPQDVRSQRHSPMQSSASMERKKGRPPILDSPGANTHLNQNLAGLNPALLASLSSLSSFDQKSLASTLSNLTGFDSKTLGAFDPKLLGSINSFDPKNNPLLSSFSSMPNLLGNISGGNFFANLASLGLSGFSGMDGMGNMNVNNPNIDMKSKARKHNDASTSSSKNAQFPFAFPNPNMLYPQLGLSGLNPFGMQAGISSAYDALGLLGNSLVTSSSSMHTSSSRNPSKTSLPRSATVTTSSGLSHSRQQKGPTDRQQTGSMSQLLLPPDTHLLESLSKHCVSYDTSTKADKRTRDLDKIDTSATDLSRIDRKKFHLDVPRTHLPPEFAAVQERLLKGDKRDIDISKMLLEQMASGALSASLVSSVESKKANEIDKELNKSMTDYSVRNVGSDSASSHKRLHEDIINEPENLVMESSNMNASKKFKESEEREHLQKSIVTDKHSHSHTGEMDLEDLIAPSTVIKTGIKPSSDLDTTQKIKSDHSNSLTIIDGNDKPLTIMSMPTATFLEGDMSHKDVGEINLSLDKLDNVQCIEQNEVNDASSEDAADSNDSEQRSVKKKGRKSTDDSTWSGVRRELRSSTGRQSTR